MPEAASSLRASLRSSGDFSGSALASSSSTSYAVRARSKGPLLASDHHDGDASRSLRRLSRDRQESAVQEKPQSEDSMSVGLTLEPQSRRSSATTTLPSVAAQAPGHSGSSARPGMLERRCISDRAGITAERNNNDAAKTAGSHLPTAVSTTSSTNSSTTISSTTGCRKPPASGDATQTYNGPLLEQLGGRTAGACKLTAGCLGASLWRATAVVFYEVLKCIMYATLLQL
eukprot:14245-Heterococcus_DN1.PRE.1